MSKMDAGVIEIKTFIARCHKCGKTTSPQNHQGASQFHLPVGWIREKVITQYDYYTATDYILLCDSCVKK